ncbi:MAG TPA: hypothetical protein VKP67_23320 [Xanthobacteraceae bacterium]|nr:hypothetical protein [Xanthobacteraceae bacterium]
MGEIEPQTVITPTPMPTTKSLVPAASSPIGFPAPPVDADFNVAAGSVATATGTSTGTTSLTLTGVSGQIGTNDVITGTGVPAGLRIVSQQSGTPSGNGVYTTSAVSTLAGVALTFTGSKPIDPAGNAPPIVVNPATVIPGEPLSKTGVATGTGTSTGTTSLTVSSVTGAIVIGSTITGAGVPAGTTVTAGPAGGGAGTYTTSVATTLTAIALTFTPFPYTLVLPTFSWMPLKVGATSKFNQSAYPPFGTSGFPWNPTPPPAAPGP